MNPTCNRCTQMKNENFDRQVMIQRRRRTVEHAGREGLSPAQRAELAQLREWAEACVLDEAKLRGMRTGCEHGSRHCANPFCVGLLAAEERMQGAVYCAECEPFTIEGRKRALWRTEEERRALEAQQVKLDLPSKSQLKRRPRLKKG